MSQKWVMPSPYEPFVPFDPVRADVVPPELDRDPAANGSSCRVMHSTHDTVEFEGTRGACIEFIGRAWWQTRFQDGPDEDAKRQFYAGSLVLENWTGRAWEMDEEITRSIMAAYDTDEELRVL